MRGTTIYPEMILQALQELSLAEATYLEVDQGHDLSDEVTVVVGTDDSSVSIAHIEHILQARLRVKPKVVITTTELALNKIGSGSHKNKIFFDKRRKVL